MLQNLLTETINTEDQDELRVSQEMCFKLLGKFREGFHFERQNPQYICLGNER